jgi:hypothetical protein
VGDLGIGRRIIPKWIIKEQDVKWIHQTPDRAQWWQDLVSTAVNIQVP